MQVEVVAAEVVGLHRLELAHRELPLGNEKTEIRGQGFTAGGVLVHFQIGSGPVEVGERAEKKDFLNPVNVRLVRVCG